MDIRVTTPQPNQDVTLSWPDIAMVPRGYELFLVDTSSGRRYQMRQASSVSLNSGANGARSAQIVAEPRGSGAFHITTLNVLTEPAPPRRCLPGVERCKT